MSSTANTSNAATPKLVSQSSTPTTIRTSKGTKSTTTETSNHTTSTKNTTRSNIPQSNTSTNADTAATSPAGSTSVTNGLSAGARSPPSESISFPTSQTIHSLSTHTQTQLSQTQAKISTSVPTATTVAPTTATTTTIATQLQIPSSQHANAQLGLQVPNRQKYLCYQLPAYHICGHASGETSLLLSREHAQTLGYSTPCGTDCAVDSTRRLVLATRCAFCTGVGECLRASLKYACGHLAGVQVSSGTRHEEQLGSGQRCDAHCRAVQVDVDVGGACKQCTWSHCCMIWAKCRCGHRDGVVAGRVLSAQHVVNFGTSRDPCDERCHFRHKDRVVGDHCTRCKPLVTPMSAVPVVVPPPELPLLPPTMGPASELSEGSPPPSPVNRGRIGLPRGAPRWMYYENMRW
ncbi:hypothetical protein F4810DRAFT_692442 [Camillea tinctor]|nr:hypothetical protein F4810DRAFT_692442 [Camillea tinctor]